MHTGACLPCRGSCVFSKYSEKLVKYFKQRSDIILIYICKNYFGYLCVENGLENTYCKTNMMGILFLLSSPTRQGKTCIDYSSPGLLPFKWRDSCLHGD